MIEVTSFGQVKSKVGQYLLAKDALVLGKKSPKQNERSDFISAFGID